MSDDVPHVWWSPGHGLVVRHPDEREQYVAVDGRNGVHLDEWPQDAKLLHPEHADWKARAETWERYAHKFGLDADARVAEAEAREARTAADAARYRAELLSLRSRIANGEVTIT